MRGDVDLFTLVSGEAMLLNIQYLISDHIAFVMSFLSTFSEERNGPYPYNLVNL